MFHRIQCNYQLLKSMLLFINKRNIVILGKLLWFKRNNTLQTLWLIENNPLLGVVLMALHPGMHYFCITSIVNAGPGITLHHPENNATYKHGRHKLKPHLVFTSARSDVPDAEKMRNRERNEELRSLNHASCYFGCTSSSSTGHPVSQIQALVWKTIIATLLYKMLGPQINSPRHIRRCITLGEKYVIRTGSAAHRTREGSLNITAHSSDGCCWVKFYRADTLFKSSNISPSTREPICSLNDSVSLYNVPQCLSLRLSVHMLTCLSYFNIF